MKTILSCYLAIVAAIAPSPAFAAEVTFGEDLFESLKIVATFTGSAVAYGICHDLVTAHVDLDYFASDRTHHGPETEEHFPSVYASKSPVRYALLWGTIATWWMGAGFGAVTAGVARIGDSRPKLSWRDLGSTMGKILAVNFVGAILVGLGTYAATDDTFEMVKNMHTYSYLANAAAGGWLMYDAYGTRSELAATQNSSGGASFLFPVATIPL